MARGLIILTEPAERNDGQGQIGTGAKALRSGTIFRASPDSYYLQGYSRPNAFN